ncbi:MAG: winged helix-turn-helix transcriptional regulator [Gemmatimonadetes bacterium]|nr:winged helix-turn-helix transcriptional regulator [Gemmatimonadota bacterium]
MSNDLRKELCDRFIAATARLHRLVYMGLRDDRKDLGQLEQVNQYQTLMLLADQGPMTVGEIAGFLGCTDSSINNILRRLDDKKMIEKARTPHDRRTVMCELTTEGLKVLERIDHVVRERVLPATESWSLEQLEAFVESLESFPPSRAFLVPEKPTELPGWFIV